MFNCIHRITSIDTVSSSSYIAFYTINFEYSVPSFNCLSILTKYCIYQDSCMQKDMAVEMFMKKFANV